jgi:hypothetical protein
VKEIEMARSTLNQTGESPPQTRKGHGTDALGPSDSTDSGSDIVGGHGLTTDEALPLDTGTNEDPDERGRDAGPDIGDTDLDSDSDRYGTGERGAAGRDSSEPIDTTLSERGADAIESDDQPEEEAETLEGMDVDERDYPPPTPVKPRGRPP